MRTPESNGLVSINEAKPIKERGFNCMKLIWFLSEKEVKDWEQWHGAHLQAAAGQCPFKDECPIYARSINKEGFQYPLPF